MAKARIPLTERIESYSIPEPNSGCWLWIGLYGWSEYGIISMPPKTGKRWKNAYAHRASYEAYKGPIPDGMLVCHRCDNRACVNPEHLFLGTQKDNLADMRRKGRDVVVRGPRSKPSSVITDDVLAAAVKLRAEEGIGHKKIAKRLGVNHSTLQHHYWIIREKANELHQG